MHDHDHVRAAKASQYRELRIRTYETSSYLRLIVEAKPINACYCEFKQIVSHRYEKQLPSDGCHSVEEAVMWTVDSLCEAFPTIPS